MHIPKCYFFPYVSHLFYFCVIIIIHTSCPYASGIDSDESRLTALQTFSQRGKGWRGGGERAPTYWINLEKDITGYLWKRLETQL